MLNRLSKTHGRLFVGLGQLCLVLGILLTRLTRDGEVALFGFLLSDFWQGVLAGLGTVLLGASIPLNLMAIRRWRDRRNRLSRVEKVD
jgi:hypothetical protein